MLTTWDERRDLIVPGDENQTLTFCVEHFIATCKRAIEEHGQFFVALSGGSTPKALFERLCQPASASQVDWQKVHLFWSDERSVPPDNKESNYHMAMEAGLKNMHIPPSHIHRMHAEKDIVQNAQAYEKTILQTLQDKPFDLIMLGLGEDGHTASLFPDTEGLNIPNRLVIANYIPQKSTWRMSMTFACIHQATHIVFYVLGPSKKQILAEVLTDTSTYPAAQVGTPAHKALWIADQSAAALLPR
jgi:6-phosphogluconolactonase